jgi:hypothetical protein
MNSGMNKIIQLFTSLVLAAVILISTSGFMVYLHHCHHHQETFASVFIDFDHHVHPHCQQEARTCCTHDDHKPIAAACDPNCCEETILLVKINPDTEPVQHGTWKVLPVIFSVHPSFLDSDSDIPDPQIAGIQSGPPEQRIENGKSIIISHKQLRIGDC